MKQKQLNHIEECVKFGLDPEKTSANTLTKAGSKLYNK